MRYLSQEWLDESRRLWSEMLDRPGASARMQYVIEGVPGSAVPASAVPAAEDAAGTVRYSVDFVDGRVAASELGPAPDPEVTLRIAYDVSVAIVRGELDANRAYADSTIGFAGDMRTLMGMFPVIWPSLTRRSGPAVRYRELQERIRAMTEF